MRHPPHWTLTPTAYYLQRNPIRPFGEGEMFTVILDLSLVRQDKSWWYDAITSRRATVKWAYQKSKILGGTRSEPFEMGFRAGFFLKSTFRPPFTPVLLQRIRKNFWLSKLTENYSNIKRVPKDSARPRCSGPSTWLLASIRPVEIRGDNGRQYMLMTS